jgi:hypothetical protein
MVHVSEVYRNVGIQEARKIVRATRSRMKGQSGDFVRGWRAALAEVDYLLKLNLVARRVGENVILEREK